MLILTRKLDESIIIGNDIEVKVVSISGSQVHIGVSAPSDIPIYRQELYEQVVAGNLEAGGAPQEQEAQVDMLANLVRGRSPKTKNADRES